MFQRNIFQVEMNTAVVRAVLSRAPVSIIANYSAIALDPVNQVVYWADVGTGTIGKTVLGGSDAFLFSAGAGECYVENMDWMLRTCVYSQINPVVKITYLHARNLTARYVSSNLIESNWHS